MTERRHLTFANLDENGKFERPPTKFPNIWRGEEFPLHFEFIPGLEEAELEEGTIVGEANTLKPTQELVWSQGSVISRSKGRKNGERA